MKQEHNPKKEEKGQSLIEMAFGLIVLLLLVGGIVDLGRAFFSTMTLRDAVQEGALYGSIDPTNTTVTANYSDFPITMPFMGAILGTQTYGLSATVTDSILRPACLY
jgi:Flp pilus assembly protein TadG